MNTVNYLEKLAGLTRNHSSVGCLSNRQTRDIKKTLNINNSNLLKKRFSNRHHIVSKDFYANRTTVVYF